MIPMTYSKWVALLGLLFFSSSAFAQEESDSGSFLPNFLEQLYAQPESAEPLVEEEVAPAPHQPHLPGLREQLLEYEAPQEAITTLDEQVTMVSLKALNKITARTEIIAVKLGWPTRFGNMEITLHHCWKAPPTERPEAKALLEIWEHKPDEDEQKIFHGWMFKSSPGLSSLEHPVYDVAVKDCTIAG